MQSVQGFVGSFLPGASISQYLRVIITAGVLQTAGATDLEIGTIQRNAFSTQTTQPQPVLFRNAPGTAVMVANGAITAGANVYAAAAGKVASTGLVLIGTAITATTTDGDFLEVLRVASPATNFLSVAAVAATGSVQGDAASLTGQFNVVSAADATKGVILPTAVAGLVIYVKNNVNAVLKVYPATGGAINAIAANGALSQAALTNALFIAQSATQWFTLPLLPS